jgi:ATP-binding cassette, subfamily B, bacterial
MTLLRCPDLSRCESMLSHPTARALRAALMMPWRSHRTAYAGQLLVMVATGLSPVVAAWLLRAILDSLTSSGGTQDLPWLVAGLTAAAGAAGVLPYLGHYLSAQSARAIERLANTELFEAVGRLQGLRKLEDPAYLDRLNMSQRVGISGPGQAFSSAVSVVQSALTLAGFLAALLVLSRVMALVLLAITIPWVAAEISTARLRAAMLEATNHAARRQYFYANMLSSLAAAKEIRLFGLGAFCRQRMLNELRLIHQTGRRVDRRQARTCSLLAVASAIVAGGGIWWAVSAAVRGKLTVGDVSLFVAALGSASAALTAIVNSAALGYQAVLTFRSYTEIVGAGPDLAPSVESASAQRLRRGIEFEDVWFRYGPDRPWVLRGVSFFVSAGQALALVGRNGAGKSTLIKLLCRFYDPDRGRILWDGVDLRDLDPAALRDRISAVFQDYMCYELTARENIAVGDLSLAAAEEALADAARRAGIHNTLCMLPKGYDTLLTRTYLDLADKQDPQTGVLLSGGQWQRVALARALLRGGRDLVILDEPSSGLDAEAEYQIHARLRAYRHGRTTILISHRLNAIRDADKILVLDQGSVAERGNHDSLMARGGTYARLFTLQARGFADQAPDDLVSSLSGAIDHE